MANCTHPWVIQTDDGVNGGAKCGECSMWLAGHWYNETWNPLVSSEHFPAHTLTPEELLMVKQVEAELARKKAEGERPPAISLTPEECDFIISSLDELPDEFLATSEQIKLISSIRRKLYNKKKP